MSVQNHANLNTCILWPEERGKQRLPENRQGAAVAQRLGGVAKFLARHIPPANLRDGANIQGQQLDGLGILLRGLTRRFGGFQEETAQHAIVELLSFRRVGNESVDDALGRC